MWHTLPRTVLPLASILLMPAFDVVIVYVLHQPVHIAQIPSLATFPCADSDLFMNILLIESSRNAG
jgi:hypothetical protein